MRNIRDTAFTGYAAFGRIGDAVLFGMNGRLFMALANNRKMFTARQKSVVSLAHNPIVFDKETSDAQTLTGAARGGDLYNLFKVFVPGRSYH